MSWNNGRKILGKFLFQKIGHVRRIRLRTQHLLILIILYIILLPIAYNYYVQKMNLIVSTKHNSSHSALTEYVDKYDTDSYCTTEFGMTMIRRWSERREDVCSPFSDQPQGQGQGQGHIFCYKRVDFEMPRLLCVFENAEMRMTEPFYTSNSSDISLDAQVNLTNGILRINCNSSVYERIPKSSREVALSSFLKEIPSSSIGQINCSNWVNHTVFWMNRYDYRNAYHCMEDVVTTFETFVLLEIDPKDVELAAYDGWPQGEALFTLWPLFFGKGVRIIRQNPFPKNTCFRKSISNMYAERSHLTNNGGYNRDMHCSSPILLGLRQYILDRYGLQHTRQKFQDNSKSKTKILFISRQHLKTRSIVRIIQNEPEIENEIQESYPNVDFRFFQPENFSTYKEQIEQVLDADILIGAHGAGLTYSLFMRPNSTLIEIFMDDRGAGNRHYHNIASWVGLNYESIGHFTGRVELTPLFQVLNRTIGNHRMF